MSPPPPSPPPLASIDDPLSPTLPQVSIDAAELPEEERRDCLHLRLAAVVLFAIAIDPNIVRASTSSTVTQEQFKKAVGIIPREGPIQPTKEDQVYGTSKEEALTKYVEKLIDILEAAGTKEAKGHIVEINAA
ncbi:hypothetical protein BGW80DRAFT_1463399 [Lactifluus volemus]|nr:hypothetical protein BGW80DRAFT_1463399 [Lactifluus volemus]